MQRTLILIKPCATANGDHDAIVERLQKGGLTLVKERYIEKPDLAVVEEHYQDNKEKDYFHPNNEFICSGPLSALVFEAENGVALARQLCGKDISIKGTIRGDFATDRRRNAVHSSESESEAKREVALWFPEL